MRSQKNGQNTTESDDNDDDGDVVVVVRHEARGLRKFKGFRRDLTGKRGNLFSSALNSHHDDVA